MTGNIWTCPHLLDTDDLEFGKHEFITYKMGQEYYGMGYSQETLAALHKRDLAQELEADSYAVMHL